MSEFLFGYAQVKKILLHNQTQRILKFFRDCHGYNHNTFKETESKSIYSMNSEPEPNFVVCFIRINNLMAWAHSEISPSNYTLSDK